MARNKQSKEYIKEVQGWECMSEAKPEVRF